MQWTTTATKRTHDPLRLPGPGDIELDWFFGSAGRLFRLQSQDLRRSAMYRSAGGRCPRCNGTGHEQSKQTREFNLSCDQCFGTGSIGALRIRRQRVADAWRACPKCRGVAGVNWDCELCWGSGAAPGVTANITVARSGEPTWMPDEDGMRRYGRIARRFDALVAAEPSLAEVLAVFHGDRGHRWGQRLALYPLTKAGQELIRISQAESAKLRRGSQDPDVTIMGYLAEQMGRRSHKALKARAEEQVRALLEAARAAWNERSTR